MRDIIILLVHLIVTVIRLAGPEGLRSVVAESALLRHQLLILNRGRKRAPSVGSRARSSLAAIRQASAARMERSRNAESAANS